VIGQPSFSAHETGINAHALSIARGRLNAAETNRLLTFDVSKISGPKDEPSGTFGLVPVAVANQSVMRGAAAVAVFGKVIVWSEAAKHQVLIWRSTTPNPGVIGVRQPDVTLGIGEPISVAYDGHRLFVGDGASHRVLVWNALPTADGQPADAVLGEVGESSTPGAAAIGTPAALVSDGTNLFVSDTANRRILVFTPGDIGLLEDAIVNSASLVSEPLAPGTLIAIRANGMANNAEAAEASGTEPLPTRLANVEVYLNGAPLPLLSVSPEEIQAQLPYDLGSATSGSLYLRSFRDNGSVLISSAAAVQFVPASPGIFAVGTREPRSGLLLHSSDEQDADGGPAKGVPITVENPATAGEVITVWASGLGLVGAGDAHSVAAGVPLESADGNTVLPITALINGEPATVLAARLPRGAVGVYDVLVVLPAHLPGGEKIRLQLVQNAVPSNTVVFPAKTIN
jgi:uncharacterized protein (TIGR03437 family)